MNISSSLSMRSIHPEYGDIVIKTFSNITGATTPQNCFTREKKLKIAILSSSSFFNFAATMSPFCEATGILFWTSVDPAHGF